MLLLLISTPHWLPDKDREVEIQLDYTNMSAKEIILSRIEGLDLK